MERHDIGHLNGPVIRNMQNGAQAPSLGELPEWFLSAKTCHYLLVLPVIVTKAIFFPDSPLLCVDLSTQPQDYWE